MDSLDSLNSFDQIVILGGPYSPYSHKLKAIMLYKHIPHIWKIPQGLFVFSDEVKATGKDVLPVMKVKNGDKYDHFVDTTPIVLRMLEPKFPKRSIIPPSRYQFFNYLIEDMADEFFTYVLFALRWDTPFDVHVCGHRQVTGWFRKTNLELAEKFSKRQTEVKNKVCGIRDVGDNYKLYDLVYEKLLEAMEKICKSSYFLFGTKPSLADFGLYGSLSQLAADPSTRNIMNESAPNVVAWINTMDNASGVDGDWIDKLNEGVEDLLSIAGQVYLPYLVAVSDAIKYGKPIEFEVYGLKYHLPLPENLNHDKHAGLVYKTKCLNWLRKDLVLQKKKLDPLEYNWVTNLLDKHDCLRYLLTYENLDEIEPVNVG